MLQHKRQHKRWIVALLVVLLVVFQAILLEVGGAPAAAQSDEGNPILRLLGFIPNTAEHRRMVTYGDVGAWYAGWGIDPITDQDDLDDLDRDTRARIQMILTAQTVPPPALGVEYLLAGDQGDYYGFDLFTVERFTYSDNLPENITILEPTGEAGQVPDLLEAAGYAAEPLDAGGTLYSLNDDYAVALDFDGPPVGRMGTLNRIAVLEDGTLLVARGTDVIEGALNAYAGSGASVAEVPAFRAAVAALDNPALDDTGTLIGLILMEGMQAGDPASALLGEAMTAEQAEALLEELAPAGELPPYLLTAFATGHGAGATYLTLVVVFPPGVDADAAASVLADRIQNYASLRTGAPLTESVAFDRALATKAEGLPAALVVLRADDPPPSADESGPVNANVFSWPRLIFTRDLGFLAVTPAD